MSNVVPVVSRTGIGPDIIQNGHNGFVFDVAATTEVIAELIDHAFLLPNDIRQTVRHLTWERFSMQIQAIAGLNATEENSDQRLRLAEESSRS